jgi:hypothetical protein
MDNLLQVKPMVALVVPIQEAVEAVEIILLVPALVDPG